MALEIERKFLVGELPDWLEACESDRIRQGYIALDGDTEVRIRDRGSAPSLTVKHGRGLVRTEVELDLDAERFEALWPLTEGRRVVKRRSLLAIEHLAYEIDVYEEDLAGLVVAEIEFGSVEASEAFVPEPWLSLEVTEDGRYKNRSLATDGAP